MKLKKYIKKIMAVGGCTLLGVTMLAGCAPEVGMTGEEYNTAIENAKAEGKAEGIASVDITSDNAGVIADAVAAVDITTDNDDAIAGITVDQVPDAIQEQILKDAAAAQAKVDADTDAKGYDVDDLILGAEFDVTISDRDIETLFDGEIDFDGDDYDAEEILYLNGLEIISNQEDKGTETFLAIPDGGMTYALTIDNSLNPACIGQDSECGEDEEDIDNTLEISFLGEDVEISEWDDNEITFTKGEDYDFIEGIEQTIEGTKIKASIIHATDDTGYVKVYVDGVGKKIYEGSTRTVNGVEIKVVEVAANDETADEAILQIGDEVEVTVKHGEEYSKDSVWDYVVEAETRTLGLTLNEEHVEADDDEDYQALAVGDKLCLPNAFLCVTYNGPVEEDTEDYTFKFDTEGEVEYVRVEGEFLDGIEDYDRIYIDEDGLFYDEDIEPIETEALELTDTDLVMLTLPGVGPFPGGIVIKDDEQTDTTLQYLFRVDLDLKSVYVDNPTPGKNNWNELSGDEDYLSNYGIVVNDPEDSIDDNKFKIEVPDEALEASITVTSK